MTDLFGLLIQFFPDLASQRQLLDAPDVFRPQPQRLATKYMGIMENPIPLGNLHTAATVPNCY